MMVLMTIFFFFFQAEDGIRDYKVTGVQTCALPILATETNLASFPQVTGIVPITSADAALDYIGYINVGSRPRIGPTHPPTPPGDLRVFSRSTPRGAAGRGGPTPGATPRLETENTPPEPRSP